MLRCKKLLWMCSCYVYFFFFNDTATTEIYTLSLHDALPIWRCSIAAPGRAPRRRIKVTATARSEEHTSELQSHHELVCRLLLEKKKIIKISIVKVKHTRHNKINDIDIKIT